MKFLIGKVADKIEKYYSTGEIVATSFMDPSEIIDVNHSLKNIPHTIYGGFEEAERKIIIIGSEEKKDFEVFTSIIRIKPNDKNIKLSHRSVLGSVLGLGLKREMIGDIIINNEICDIIILNNITEFILNNLKYIGREKVEVEKINLSDIQDIEDTSKEIKTTVSSLRIDSIISAGFGLSREKSADLIKGEMVKLNFLNIKSVTKSVKESDIISVRGKGRLVVASIIGESKNGRIKVILLRK